MYKPQV